MTDEIRMFVCVWCCGWWNGCKAMLCRCVCVTDGIRTTHQGRINAKPMQEEGCEEEDDENDDDDE